MGGVGGLCGGQAWLELFCGVVEMSSECECCGLRFTLDSKMVILLIYISIMTCEESCALFRDAPLHAGQNRGSKLEVLSFLGLHVPWYPLFTWIIRPEPRICLLKLPLSSIRSTDYRPAF